MIARALPGSDVLLIGPGLGTAPGVRRWSEACSPPEAVEALPVVLDADALNCLARFPGWHARVKAKAVLTPHPGEAARLANLSVAEVQASRLPTPAQRLAREWQQTLVSRARTRWWRRRGHNAGIAPSNAALATAGTGDVLAGTIAGLSPRASSPPWRQASASTCTALRPRSTRPTTARRGCWRASWARHRARCR